MQHVALTGLGRECRILALMAWIGGTPQYRPSRDPLSCILSAPPCQPQALVMEGSLGTW